MSSAEGTCPLSSILNVCLVYLSLTQCRAPCECTFPSELCTTLQIMNEAKQLHALKLRCMCACMYVYGRCGIQMIRSPLKAMRVGTHLCMWTPEVEPRCLLQRTPPPYPLRHSLLPILELPALARVASQQAKRTLLPLLPRLWGYRPLCGCRGAELRFSGLCGKNVMEGAVPWVVPSRPIPCPPRIPEQGD